MLKVPMQFLQIVKFKQLKSAYDVIQSYCLQQVTGFAQPPAFLKRKPWNSFLHLFSTLFFSSWTGLNKESKK